LQKCGARNESALRKCGGRFHSASLRDSPGDPGVLNATGIAGFYADNSRPMRDGRRVRGLRGRRMPDLHAGIVLRDLVG